MLGELPVRPGPADLDDLERHPPAGRPDAGKLALVGAVAGDALHHPVVFGDLVFHDGVEIREDTQGQRQPVPQRREAGDGLAAGDVVNAVGGDELIGDGEVALVEDLLDNAAGPGLQLVRGHGCAPWGSRQCGLISGSAAAVTRQQDERSRSLPFSRTPAVGPMASGDTGSFGALLKRQRLAAGLTQEALAERAGLSAKAVSDLERDPARTPRLGTVTLLADALGRIRTARAELLAAARPTGPGAAGAAVHANPPARPCRGRSPR